MEHDAEDPSEYEIQLVQDPWHVRCEKYMNVHRKPIIGVLIALIIIFVILMILKFVL